MEKQPIKLVGRRQWVISIVALAIGASLPLYREYSATGTIQTSNVVISIVIFVAMLLLCAAIFRYANRPEPPEPK